MKTKKILTTLFIVSSFTLFFACSSAEKPNDSEKILETVPEELKDTAVLNNDEENALDKLNNVIDTSSHK